MTTSGTQSIRSRIPTLWWDSPVEVAQTITLRDPARFSNSCNAPNGHSQPQNAPRFFVRDRSEPYWFATARETIAFTLLPEMPKGPDRLMRAPLPPAVGTSGELPALARALEREAAIR
jgi:hypothetical protein